MTSKFSSYLREHWKLVLNVITVFALVIFVIVIRKQLAETFRNLAKVNAWALLLLIPIEFWNYHAQTKLYQGLFKIFGNKLKYRPLFEASLELNFINSVFPSGGVSGISYFGARMRSEEISGGRATTVQLMKIMLVFLSFEILLVFGLLIMAIFGHVNNVTILISGVLTTLLVILTLIVAFVFGDHKRINATFAYVTRFLNRLIHFVRPRHPHTIDIERFRPAINELHVNYNYMVSNYRELKWPLIHALEANFSEVLAIYVVYLAFGHWVNFGAVILAYAVANFAGFVSVLPSGVGVYEALMTAVLVAGGIPARLSLPVTVMYRVLNTLIQVPPGYVFYHRTLHTPDKPKDHVATT